MGLALYQQQSMQFALAQQQWAACSGMLWPGAMSMPLVPPQADTFQMDPRGISIAAALPGKRLTASAGASVSGGAGSCQLKARWRWGAALAARPGGGPPAPSAPAGAEVLEAREVRGGPRESERAARRAPCPPRWLRRSPGAREAGGRRVGGAAVGRGPVPARGARGAERRAVGLPAAGRVPAQLRGAPAPPPAGGGVRRVFRGSILGGVQWSQPMGRIGPIPRKTAWLVSAGCQCAYRYGSLEVTPQEFPPWMLGLMRQVMPLCGLAGPEDFPNCCNLNLYEGGGNSVGWHSDDEALFQGKFSDCRIISLSLGVARRFELRLNWPEPGERATVYFLALRVSLGDGDLCTMEGMTQKHLQHRVPAETNVSGARINLGVVSVCNLRRVLSQRYASNLLQARSLSACSKQTCCAAGNVW
ncbi:unnamed protein product, partial [Prorocentrum cordatum]